MDLQHILQPQADPARGRTPKRPSLSASRPTLGGQRHAATSSEPQYLPSTTPPPPQMLQSSRSVLAASRAQSLRGALHPRYWLGDVDLDAEDLDDEYESLSGDGSSNGSSNDSEEAEVDREDAFSVEFTLGSDSSLDSEPSPDISQFDDGSSQHFSSFPTDATPTFQSLPSLPEPIDLTLESSSPDGSPLPQASTSGKRSWQDSPMSAHESSHDTKRRRTSHGASSIHPQLPTKCIEEIDLLGDDDDDAAIASIVSKQREEQVKAQAPRATEPTKLTTLQCTVCLDAPTDLTATVCGHAFCRKCLIEWLISGEREHPKRSNCPACRKSIKRNSKYDTIPLEIMVRPRNQVRLTPRVSSTES